MQRPIWPVLGALCFSLSLSACSRSHDAELAKARAEADAAKAELAKITAQTKGNVDFTGKWDGKYVDSLGGKGQGVYEFGEEKDGQWTVKVSWKADGVDQWMSLTGKRQAHDALRLEGTSEGIVYRYVGGIQNGDLVLGYDAEKAGVPHHFGVSRLTRQKK